MNNQMSFSQRGKVEANENDEDVIIELSSDDDEAEQPPSNRQQHNDNQPMNSSTLNVQQFKVEIVNDSIHMNSMNQYLGEAYQDDGVANIEPTIEDHFRDPCLSEESDGDELLDNLKTKYGYSGNQTVQLHIENAQPGPRYQMDHERTSAPSPATALVTSTTNAPMTPASSAPSPLPNRIFSTESQSNFESCTSQNMHAEMNQKNVAGDSSFNDFFNNIDPQSAQAVSHLIDSKVKEQVKECMAEFLKKYDIVPKDSQNADDSTSKKQKRKHHHNKLERNAADSRSMKREKFMPSSNESSLDGLFGPSTSTTSTPKYPAGKRGDSSSSGNKKASASKIGSSPFPSNAGYFRFGNDFSFGRTKPLPRAQPKPVPKRAPKMQKDYGAVKNDDATLYLASAAARKCPLCFKTYKRMVSHFRNVHSNYEVFVSRLAPQIATNLKRSNPFVTKYTRPNGMPYLRMWCPFCEDDKDFFVPYWANHIRTHTGEYTNECIVCSKISLNASHCGQATLKQKCNLNEDGLPAYLCSQCNWIQLDEERVKAHVEAQHGVVGAYTKIVLIPALNPINAPTNPRSALAHATSVQQRPPIATNDRPTTRAPSSGIQVLESVVLHPPALNTNVHTNAAGFSDLFGRMTNNSEMNDSFRDGLNLMAQANQLLNDRNDDVQMVGDFPDPSAANCIEMIKVDAIDDQVLQTLYDTYGNNATNSYVVRPWMDGDYGLKKLCTDDICQFALYKCMYEKCIFATNSTDSWQIHMAVHGQLIDFFQEKGSLEKNVRDKLIMFRECPYCSFTAKADHQVLRHMEEDHRRSIFQCAMCYYRTIEMDNMVLHMQNYHPGATKEVLLCGDVCEFLGEDEEILQQDCENYEIIKKIPCGQDDCTEEYACYNSLYLHLMAVHPGTYICPNCSQTMGMDEPMIVDHLKMCGFPEFKCLKCDEAFHNVQAIREHMSVAHPSNYLFVGARRAKQPCDEQDEIQIVYVGGSQNAMQYSFIKCAQPYVLDGMDPKHLDTSRQKTELEILRMETPDFKTSYNGNVPRIVFQSKSQLEFLRYSAYAELNVRQDKKSMPLMVSYKCITVELLHEVPTIADFIDREKDIDRTECKAVEFTGSMASMLRHRCKKHPSPIVFLQTDQQLPHTVRKIVRCTYQCELCAGKFTTRMDLRRHFYSMHSNRWIAAKILVSSQIIESNDPQQPIGPSTESIEYFCCTVLKCTREGDCNGFAGTRTEAIAHYNEEHHDGTAGSRIDGFQAQMVEHIIAHKQSEIEPYLLELRSSHQIYLFECQHCWKLFHSLAAISEHFVALRAQNIPVRRRFSVKRLYCCLEDNTVRTLAGMQQYANENPNQKSIVPVNMQLPTTYCGLCNYNYLKNGNLPAHFEQKHKPDGDWCRDTYNDAFLNSLNLGTIDPNTCQFASGCCGTGDCNLLRQVMDHVLSCKRRFRCEDCPRQVFTSTVSFVTHCIGHDQNADSTEILEGLHDFKAFLVLLANMQIVLPNGLVLERHEIRDTAFGNQLQGQIGQLAQESWKRERDNLSLMAIV